MKNFVKNYSVWLKQTKVGKLITASVFAVFFTALANVWPPFIYVAVPFWLGLAIFTLYAIYVAFKNTFK